MVILLGLKGNRHLSGAIFIPFMSNDLPFQHAKTPTLLIGNR